MVTTSGVLLRLASDTFIALANMDSSRITAWIFTLDMRMRPLLCATDLARQTLPTKRKCWLLWWSNGLLVIFLISSSLTMCLHRALSKMYRNQSLVKESDWRYHPGLVLLICCTLLSRNRATCRPFARELSDSMGELSDLQTRHSPVVMGTLVSYRFCGMTHHL